MLPIVIMYHFRIAVTASCFRTRILASTWELLVGLLLLTVGREILGLEQRTYIQYRQKVQQNWCDGEYCMGNSVVQGYQKGKQWL